MNQLEVTILPAPTERGMEDMPSLGDSVAYVQSLRKPIVADVLRTARRNGRIAIQPRCGVGDHSAMLTLLRVLEAGAQPDILTITIDSHTRLKRFHHAWRSLNSAPSELNGYPLVTHGWRRGRELNEAIAAPLEIRHGSPDGRVLFNVSVASGITSFEGGGISYNLPYSKNVPIAESLAAWRDVDAICGELAHVGLIIDRELFGTLTAVLVPPSVSLAVSFLEAAAAAREGVRCISVAYPQGGNAVQDVAALRSIPELASRYLPSEIEVYPTMHEFMGVFPRERRHAEELIFYGALVARLGGATKLITKTCQEAFGIPDAQANIDGMLTAAMANSPLFDPFHLDEERITEEMTWIVREVAEIVEPVLDASDLYHGIVRAFASGTLDIPFSASLHARSDVIPRRDSTGAIRYFSHGSLPLSDASVERNQKLLGTDISPDGDTVMTRLIEDINYFIRFFKESVHELW